MKRRRGLYILLGLTYHRGDLGLGKVDCVNPRVDMDLCTELDGTVEECLEEVCAVNDPVRRAKLVRKCGQVGEAENVARLPAAEVDRAGLDGAGFECAKESPAAEEARDVWCELDTGADFGDFGRGLEDRHAVAGEEGGDGCGQATQAAADDEDVQAAAGGRVAVGLGVGLGSCV